MRCACLGGQDTLGATHGVVTNAIEGTSRFDETSCTNPLNDPSMVKREAPLLGKRPASVLTLRDEARHIQMIVSGALSLESQTGAKTDRHGFGARRVAAKNHPHLNYVALGGADVLEISL